ncbi:MAG: B12-binding domain-containing radical SAM protein [Gemmatimonadota bacterium]|nr:B12-binding domain-containing radical SAM protein [Gemmatimonadota bacterium]
MKILLVKPPLSAPTIAAGEVTELEPLELEYLAAALRDHDVAIVDLRYDRDVETALHRFQPDVVGVTALSVQVDSALAVLRAARRADPGIVTVVGGHHATLLPGDFQRAEVDVIVCGEGAFTFAELLQRLERGVAPSDVPGLWYRRNDAFVHTGPRNDIERIDDLPLPDREVTSRYRHRYIHFWWRPAALMRASSGCAYRCAYCPIWKAAGGKWCYRDPERVAEELAGIREGFVYFADDNMFFDRDRMTALHRAIVARDIRKEYFLFSRADAIVRCRDLLPRWAEIGLRQVFLGLEAVDVDTLKPLNKRTNAATDQEAVRLLLSNGIDPLASFMVFPDFGVADFDRVYDYVEQLGVYYCEYSVLTPAPGSDLHYRMRDQLTTDDYRRFDYMHPVLPTRLREREFFRQLARLYWRTYSPSRALRVRPCTPPPVTLAKLARNLWMGWRMYRRIRNGYRAGPASVHAEARDAPVSPPARCA